MLAACGTADAPSGSLAKAEAQQGAAADDEGRILCARAGSASFARVCTLDRISAKQGLLLTISHPDGGFHRLLVTSDGRGVIAADGAEPAKVTIVGQDQIEVALGGDRYRLPATVKAAKPAS
ncbi:MAG: hypothetical protein K2Y03_01890 [Sphingomonas sp.]|nr:hypothetical protein [Sphingomonas sp.]